VTPTAAQVAAFGLEAAPVTLDPVPNEPSFTVLVSECEHQRVLGLLGAAVEQGALDVTEEQRATLDERWRGWLGHDLRLEQLVLRVASALEEAGIPFRVLKGIALAHAVYDDPAWRVFGDADILVHPGRFSEAVAMLADVLGAERAQPELRPGFDQRFGKEAILRTDDGLELDLHRTFVEGALGLTIPLEELFTGTATVPIGGRDLPVLDGPARLLHACYSAAVGDWPPRLSSLRDVAQIVTTERPATHEVVELARRSRAEAVVARALTLAWDELGLTDEPTIVDWARRHRPSFLERLLLASHLGPARAYTRHASALLVLRGVRARAAYLRAIAFPQSDYLAARHLTNRSHVGRIWRRLRP
jgi:hypothetical protein